MLEIAFTLFSTAVTWLELIAFVLAIANIACNVGEIHWAWPLTFIASLLYAWLFFASKLYGEAGVNIFFAVSALWGWWQWLNDVRAGVRTSAGDGKNSMPPAPLKIASLNRQGWRTTLLAWALLWAACSALLHSITDSNVPIIDGFLTAGSIVGTVLLGRKYIENWPLWLIVNVVSIALFVYKQLPLTAILYGLFLALALWGWRVWWHKLAAHKIAGNT